MPKPNAEEVRRSDVRRLFIEHHSTPTGADVYLFSGWLLQNRPDLVQNKPGTFYEDLKSDLDGLWAN